MKALPKRIAILCMLVATSLLPLMACAMQVQPEEEQQPTLFERIEEESEGNVEFEIPENIADKIFTTPSAPRRQNVNPGQKRQQHGVIKKQGYRVQVFSDSRNQGSLQARAKARGNAIASRFPKYRGQVYTFSSAPNWFTRVGNFSSHAEANAAMAELKRAFPSFAGEMRVVKCNVTIVR